MLNRSTFNALESAAERGEPDVLNVLGWIDAVIQFAFAEAPEGFRLDGSDACERVAEALAAWIKESAPRRFADMTGTRYSVTGVDCSADGMERLRDQCESILLAYPAPDDSPDDLAAAWIADLDSVAQPDGFAYDAAEHAIREYVRAATESGYLPAKLAESAAFESGCNPAGLPLDEFESDFEPATFRLYLRDNAPESE